MLDEVDIRVYWDANKDPDILSFDDEEASQVAFDKIVKGIVDGEKIVRVSDPADSKH